MSQGATPAGRFSSDREGGRARGQAAQRGVVDQQQQPQAAHLDQAQVRHRDRLALRHLARARPAPGSGRAVLQARASGAGPRPAASR